MSWTGPLLVDSASYLTVLPVSSRCRRQFSVPHIASLYPYMSAQAQDPCRSQESQYNRKQRILYPVIHCTASRIRPLNRVIWRAVFCGQLLDIQQVNDRDSLPRYRSTQTALICHRHGASGVQNSCPKAIPRSPTPMEVTFPPTDTKHWMGPGAHRSPVSVPNYSETSVLERSQVPPLPSRSKISPHLLSGNIHLLYHCRLPA